ncbi:MAG TPA: aminofutalosine synthase MqnE [Dissulfurispiraceae bacterium]|nr:aminofutalosine synthase MqnE [Dissulfurispiraceae bacterium]
MIEKVHTKLDAGGRLTRREAVKLFESDDLFGLGRLADEVARKKNGKKAYFIVNRHINPTNICVNRCKFCAYSRSSGEEGAFNLSVEEMLARIEAAKEGAKSLSEVHIVGGLHPDRPFNFYVGLIAAIRKRHPKLNIKAFTAVEIDYFSRISGLSVQEVLIQLRDAGLQIMPGGGAEIFAEGVRNKVCPEKIPGKRWLEVMKTAHQVGIRTNATMLYGHWETYADRVDHLFKLRELQDQTGGFQAFIPLAYHPKNTEMGGAYSSGIDDLKTIAVSRLVLDNFDHIKAYWIMLGEKISQVALLFGADDIDGTIIEEKIALMAGGLTEGAMTREDLIVLIRKAGKRPVERDGLYKELWKE